MTALSAYRQTVAKQHPALPLELDNGVVVSIKSLQAMEDDQLDQFNDAQKKLAEVDEAEDHRAVKEAMVDLLAVASDNPAAVRESLRKESFGVLTLIYEDYTKNLADATKSKGDSGVSEQA